MSQRHAAESRSTTHDEGSSRPQSAKKEKRPELVMERFGSIDQMDRSFDIEYWQRQGDAAIFRAVWELVEAFWRDQGRNPDELRLQRSVEAFQRLF